MRRVLLILVGIICCNSTMVSQTIPANTWEFTPSSTFPGPGGFGDVATGDFNNDGLLDFVTSGAATDSSPSSVVLFLKQTDGSFLPTTSSIIPSSPFHYFLIRDVNNDSKDDIVIVNSFNTIDIFLQGLNGTFTALNLPANLMVSKALIEDFNNDGLLDIFVSGFSGLALYYQQVNGTFIPSNVVFNSSIQTGAVLGAGDIDDDGDLDILISGRSLGGLQSLAIYLQDSTGNFISTAHNLGSALYLSNDRNVIIRDVDNDGMTDILISGNTSSRGEATLLLVKTSNTSLTYSEQLIAGTAGDIEVVDFNNDGLLDIFLSATFNSNTSRQYSQQINGTFNLLEIETNADRGTAATGDLNGDGVIDMVSNRYLGVVDFNTFDENFTGEIKVFYNSLAGLATVNTQNITVQLDATGNAIITPQDINNGSTDSAGNPATNLSLDRTSVDCDDIGNKFNSGSVSLDGINDYLSTPIDADVIAMPQTTWETWVRPTSNNAVFRFVFGIDDGGWDRFVVLNGDEIRVAIGPGPAGSNYVVPRNFVLNEWQHMAVSYDQNANEVIFYFNGNPYGPYATTFANQDNTIDNFMVGASDITTGAGGFFQGQIDEVRVWNTIRTETEIKNNLFSVLNGDEANLTAYYRFEEVPSSITATDTAVNSNNATLNNMSTSSWSFQTVDLNRQLVVLTVQNGLGISNDKTAFVKVIDDINPTFTCAADVSSSTTDSNGVIVNYSYPTITDACDTNGVAISGLDFLTPSGTSYIGARNGSMYFLSDTAGTMVNNYATAAATGYNLVIINDQDENDYLTNLLSGLGDNIVQIGLDDLDTEGTFEWQDGTPTTYTNWNISEPNNSNNEDYVQLIISGPASGSWNDGGDGSAARFIIEMSTGTIQQPAATTALGSFNGNSYFISDTAVLPSVAFATTASNGYKLLTIDNAAENAYITSRVGAYSLGVVFGLNDLAVEGTFVNQNGSAPSYINWNSGEPNNSGSGEDYVTILPNGFWNDIGDGARHYIIEMPTPFVQTAGLLPGELFPIGTTANSFVYVNKDGTTEICSTEVEVILDTTAPTLTGASILSDNSNSAFAKAGNTITLTFTANEDLQPTPVVTIAGQNATVAQGVDAQNWTATYMVPSIATLDQTALPDGSVSFTVDFADLLGNNATQVTTTTDASAINIDRTIPSLTVVGIASDNRDSAFAKAGDTITLTFISDEDLATPAVTIAGQTATVQQGSDAQNWTATYLVPNIATLDQTALPDGGITFSIQHADAVGNTATTTATTDSSTATLLRTNPNAVAQNITVALDVNGNATITPQDINDGSTDGAGDLITNLSLDLTSFDCSDVTQSNLADNLVIDLTNANNYINAGSNSSLRMSSQLSIALWVNASSSGGTLNTIAHKEGEYTLAQWFDGSLRYGVANSSPGWSHVNSGYILPTNEWVHIVFTYVSGAPKIYVNGELVHTGSGTGNIRDADFSRNDLRFGWRQDNFLSSFNGYLDEISVWNRALTSSEVENIVNSSLTGNENGLQLYYPINTTNNTVDDLGPNNLDGTLFNTVSTPIIIDNSLRGGIGTEVILTASDAAGNSDTATAFVTILDNTESVITLNGNATQTIAQGSTYTDPGATATDNCSLDVNGVVVGGDTVDTATLGTYVITYNATDVNGNTTTELTRTVVVEDQTAPVLMLSLSSDNGFNSAFAKAGDLITLSLIANEDLQASLVVTIAGQTVTVTQGIDAQNWTATYTVPDVATLDQTILPDGVVLITVAYSDIVGNTGSLSNTTDGTAVQIKRTAPDASTQDITVALDANGNATITPQDVSNAAASSCLEGMSYGGAVVKVQGSTGTQMGNSSSTFVTGTSNGFPVAFVPAPASRQASTLYDGIKVRAGDIVVLRVDSSSPGRVGASPSFNIASGLFVWGGYSPNGNFANRPELQIQQAGKSAGDIIDFSSPFNLRLRANGNYMRSGSTWNSSSTPEDLTVSLETGDLGATDPCANITYQLDQDTFNCLDTGMNTVTITATDGIGNSSTATALVTVIDDTVPVINCVNDINARALDPNGVVVTYAEPTVTDNCFSNGMPLTVSQLNEAPAGTTLLGTYNGHNYFISTATYTSNEAYDITAALTTGYMVTIDDVAENTFITNALTNAGQFTAFIGLHDRTTDGVYEWQNGDPVNYINWNSGEPNNAPPGERHVQIRNGGWDDVLDTHINPYIVEVPFSVEQTSGFASGEMFPTGTTTNTFVFNFSDGSSQTCSFDVNIDQDFLYENGVWTPNDPSSSQNPSGLDDNVVIRDNVTISNTIRANDFTVENGALLSIDNSAVIFVANNLAVQNLDARDAVIVAFGQDNSNTWNFNNTVLGTLELANADLFVTGDIRLTTALRNDDTVSTSTLDVTGANLTFVSDANGTALVDGSQIDIIGEVTVEQYYQDRRAFRFIGSPVNMTSTIFDNLQQGGLNFGDTGYEPGYGTHITGASAPANGFDPTTTNNPSMFGWDNVNQNWVVRTSTNQSQDVLSAGEFHRLMVRGNREIDLTSNLSSSATTLRYKGSLLNSSYSVNALAINENEFVIVGNPYQSQINLNAYLQNSFNGINTNISAVKPLFYFVWDPMVNTRGAYRTYSLQLDEFVGGNAPTSDFIPGTLRPGQSAFFVASGTNGGSFQISRDSNALVPPNPNASITSAQSSLALRLFETNQLHSGSAALDAILIRFETTSNNGVDAFDAIKFSNLDENISRNHVSGTGLSIENRAMPVDSEVLSLSLNNFRYNQYTLQASPVGLVGMHAYLKDNFTNNLTQLSNNQSTTYSFLIDTADPLSADPNRFEITFQNTTLSSQDVLGLENQIKLYPNPVLENTLYIDFKQLDGRKDISLYNALGQLVNKWETISSNIFELQNLNVAPGVYLIKIENGNQIYTEQLIVK